MQDYTLCVPSVSRYAGGTAKLVRQDASYVFPHPPYAPGIQRQVSAIPASNTVRFAVTASVSDSSCLPCRTTEPDEELTGGDIECLAPTGALDQCVVQDLQSDTTWSGPCSRLVNRDAPPSDGPSPLLIGLGLVGIVTAGVAIGALIASGRSKPIVARNAQVVKGQAGSCSVLEADPSSANPSPRRAGFSCKGLILLCHKRHDGSVSSTSVRPQNVQGISAIH